MRRLKTKGLEITDQQIESKLYYERVFNGRHCYKYESPETGYIVVTHDDKNQAKTLIMEKIKSKFRITRTSETGKEKGEQT